MLELYKQVRNCDLSRKTLILSVISGDHFGEKAILCQGELVHETAPSGFFASHREELLAVNHTSVVKFDDGAVFCELLCGEKHLVICGAGHVSMPIIKIGKMIGFNITVIEDRPSFADNARKAGADEVVCDAFVNALSGIPGTPDTYFVIVTRGHRYDLDCLVSILQKPAAYIGMMGSRGRVAGIRKTLAAEYGFDAETIERLHAPIGLRISAETPEEIAVSIMGEIVQVKNEGRNLNGFTEDLFYGLLDETMVPVPKFMATIVSKRGSTPRGLGTKMLILRDGRTVGTIGGGCAEAAIITKAMQKFQLDDMSTVIARSDMSGRDVEEDAMHCGGAIDVLIEAI